MSQNPGAARAQALSPSDLELLGLSPDADASQVQERLERLGRQASSLALTAPERSQLLRDRVREIRSRSSAPTPAYQPSPRFCTACGRPRRPGARFCTGCGQRFAGQPSAADQSSEIEEPH